MILSSSGMTLWKIFHQGFVRASLHVKIRSAGAFKDRYPRNTSKLLIMNMILKGCEKGFPLEAKRQCGVMDARGEKSGK